jgi:hypothetical protein
MTAATPQEYEPASAHPAWEAARLAGLDMELVEECLAMPPEERIRLHTVALVSAEALQCAMTEQVHASALAARLPPEE